MVMGVATVVGVVEGFTGVVASIMGVITGGEKQPEMKSGHGRSCAKSSVQMCATPTWATQGVVETPAFGGE